MLTRLIVRLCAFAALAVLLLASPPARADEAAARAHFKKGIDLYDKKQYAEALAAFQDAYKEKPSAGIKQNIALSLKGLNKPAEAATSFDEALEEGKGTLKPETKGAIERELAELSRIVATVRLKVVTADDKPADAVVISLEPLGEKRRPLSAGAHQRPIRLMPGIYTFTAHLDGYPDPPEKKFALVTGAPVDATFVLGTQPAAGPNAGTLTVKASVEGASIRLDGVEVGRTKWSGPVPQGNHKLEVSAPGWKTTTADVPVSAGAAVDYPVTLQAIGDAPGEYVAPGTKPVKPKRFYVAMMGTIDTAGYRLSPSLGEAAPSGKRRSLAGLSVGARAGYLVNKRLALEVLADVGVMSKKYKLDPADAVDTRTTVVHWQLAPVVRFLTPGKVRFTAGTGFGVHGLAVESKIAQPGSTLTKKGQGVGFSWLIDAGMQADVGSIFLELGIVLNVHGVGAVDDSDPPERRLLLASPAVRGGLRAGLGIPF